MSQRREDAKRLLNALTDVDDRYVQEALHTGRIRKHNEKAKVLLFRRTAGVVAAAAACGIIAVAAGRFGLLRSGNSTPSALESADNSSTALESSAYSFSEDGGISGTQSDSDLQVASAADADHGESADDSGDGSGRTQATGTSGEDTAAKESAEADSGKDGRSSTDSAGNQAAAKENSSGADSSAGDSADSASQNPDSEQGSGTAEDSQNGEASDNTQVAAANSDQGVSSLSEAASIAGFSLSVPEADASYPNQVVNVVNQSTIQVDYTTSDGSDTEYTVRKAKGSSDISGDYNSYANSEQRTVNGATVTLKGNGDTWSVATWSANGYTYAVNAENHPMSEDWILEIISDVK